MSTKPGMTLIEIIVSIAMIALIAIGIIPAFATNYKMIIYTRSITQNTYEAQKNMENTIEGLKDYIDTNNTENEDIKKMQPKDYYIFASGGDGIDFSKFSSDGVNIDIKDFKENVKIDAVNLGNGDDAKRTISAYTTSLSIKTRENNDSDKKLITMVANIDRPVYTVPWQENTALALYKDDNKITFAYPTDSILSILRIDATYDAVKFKDGEPDPTGQPVPVLKYLNRWYVSKEGFYIPQYNKPNGIEVGIKYPTFPNDYVIIAGADTQSFSSINESYESFAGKHLIYTITGAAYSGVMGPYDVSKNTIYFSGLTVTNNLFIHLDASMLDKYTKKNPSKPASGYKYINNKDGIIYLRGWNDLSNNSTIKPQDEEFQPSYNEDDFAGENSKPTKYVGYINFDGNDRVLLKNNKQLDKSNMGIFVAFKSDVTNADSNDGKNIIDSKEVIEHMHSPDEYKDSWSLGFNTDKEMTFLCNGVSVTDNVSPNICDGKWHIIKINSNGGKLYLSIDGNKTAETLITVGQLENDRIIIGEEVKGDLGEVIGYTSIANTDDITKVENYLKAKYSVE